MDFDDLISECAPPPNRRGKQDGENEHRFYEGAVMVAYAMHLFRTEATSQVAIHPDGMHGKQFDFLAWLERQGFKQVSRSGSTKYAGVFIHNDGRKLVVDPTSGKGDVVATVGSMIISAECKGGIINTRHSGQKSKLYRGLCETVGLLLGDPFQWTAGCRCALYRADPEPSQAIGSALRSRRNRNRADETSRRDY
jgi:hypothetical protein